MDVRKNFCSGITPQLMDLQPIMIHHRIYLIAEYAHKENKVWSDDASCRVPDLISVLFKLHKPKSAGLFNSIRWYITSNFKLLSQTLFEKIDLTIMDLSENLCPGIMPKIINLTANNDTSSNLSYYREYI